MSNIPHEAYNIFPEHQVYASIMAEIITKAGNKQIDDAKRICILTISAVLGLLEKEFKYEDYARKDIFELVYELSRLEKQAGIAPVQLFQGKSVFARALKKAEEDMNGERRSA